MKLFQALLCTLLLAPLAFSQCSDFFRAAKVSDFMLSGSSYSAGSAINGSLLLENSLDLPLPDSTLTLQILRDSEGAFGRDIVDEFTAEEKFDLAPGASKRISFSWQAPEGLPAGEYSVNAYAHSAGFNTGGVSFIEGLSVASSHFSLANNYPDYILINRTSVLLSNSSYNALNVNSLIEQEQGANVSVEFELVNYGEAGRIVLLYRLYVWDKVKHAELERLAGEGLIPPDSPLAKNILSANAGGGRITLDMGANESRHVLIPIGALPPDAYLLEVRASKNQAHTLFQMRIPVKGDKGAVRFAALSPFPMRANEPAAISTCISSITRLGGPSPLGAEEVDANVEISLRVGEAIIHSDSREVSHTPSITLSEFNFTPQSDYGDLRLLISILDLDGSLIDLSEVYYADDDFERPNVLAIESAELNGRIRYRLTLTDSEGRSLAGRIVLFLKDSQGNVVETLSSELLGELEGIFQAPAGGYALEAQESTYGLTASSSNSPPYAADRPLPDAGPRPGGTDGAEGGQAPSLLVLAAAAILAILLLALVYHTLKGLKGKKFAGE